MVSDGSAWQADTILPSSQNLGSTGKKVPIRSKHLFDLAAFVR
jgi:hypothetical protein